MNKKKTPRKSLFLFARQGVTKGTIKTFSFSIITRRENRTTIPSSTIIYA
jgi:hypothetical protein